MTNPSAFLHESLTNETNWQASADGTAPFEWRLSSSEPKPRPAAECGSPAADELSYLPIRSSALPAVNQNKKYTKHYAKENDKFQRTQIWKILFLSVQQMLKMLRQIRSTIQLYPSSDGFFCSLHRLHPLHDFEGSTNRLAIVRSGHRQGINGTDTNVS